MEAVKDIAVAKETWPGAVALSWIMAQPAVVAPIVGANSVEQLEANLESLEISLDETELAKLTQVSG